MTPDEIRAALAPYNLKKVAKTAGLSHTAVWRFASGKTANPSWEVVNKLSEFLKAASAQGGEK